ncbi:hypothetical protein [Sphingobium sp.]|uniref:hypothetical protein n=1 Tax=Sphingobium sp. TaxID=1912891 RepID=UPI0025DE8C2D|nr:hypothetical protein [Sphingobium sp.]
MRGAALVLAFELWTTAGRALSATCTAPPPMIAPPQVQAHNFAKAIRTDIGSTLVLLPLSNRHVKSEAITDRDLPMRKNAKESVNCNAVNSESTVEVERFRRFCSSDMVNVPLWHGAVGRR